MTERKQITVIGRVQGVYYRAYTEKRATELNLTGFVKNLSNGNVFIDVEGSAEDIKALIEWCYTGSPLALVRTVEIEDIPTLAGYTGFTIKR
jgi:acylphosphatase